MILALERKVYFTDFETLLVRDYTMIAVTFKKSGNQHPKAGMVVFVLRNILEGNIVGYK